MSNSILLQCKQLCKRYQEGRVQVDVLRDVNFTMRTSEMIAITGSSGSGKSTLLHLLGGLDTPTSGSILFRGHVLNNMNSTQKAELRNRELGFIYQFHHLLPDFNALENVAIPLLISKKSKQDAQNQAMAMLKAVGLVKRAMHRPAELSGGERQRVAIARSLVNNPRLVLADEPTGNLDTHNADAIFDLLEELNICYGTAFLIVTHNMYLAKRLFIQREMQDGHLNDITSITRVLQ